MGQHGISYGVMTRGYNIPAKATTPWAEVKPTTGWVQYGWQAITMQSSSGATREWGDTAMVQVSNGVAIIGYNIPTKAAAQWAEVKRTSIGCSVGGRR